MNRFLEACSILDFSIKMTIIKENFAGGREQLITDLVGERLNVGNNHRNYQYTLPSEQSQGYYVDEVNLYLFSTGACIVYTDIGNIDHNSNNHLIGVYEETDSEINVRAISVWREDEPNVVEYRFKKAENNTLLYDDGDLDKVLYVRQD